MGLSREARDPWGPLVGALAGGLAWAVGISAPGAAAIGAIVYGVKVAAGGLLDRAPRPAGPRIRQGSPEERWVRRASRAIDSLARLADSAPSGPVRERAEQMAAKASVTLTDVRRLAAQASAAAIALDRIDVRDLDESRERLRAQGASAPDHVRAEVERSLSSIEDQFSVYQRLAQASEGVKARIEAVVLGLEGLVARLVEVLALVEAQSPVAGAQQIDALADELEGLRAGLAETEDLSRRALTAYQTEAPQGAATKRSRKGRGGRDAEAS